MGDKTIWFENRLEALKNGDKIIEVMLVATDIAQRKTAEAKLEATRKKLIEKAHQTGQSDVAINTLHNVGNILNSVKTSAHIVGNIVREPHLDNLKKANSLLRQNISNLNEFVVKDPKGKKLMEYYLKIEEGFERENHYILKQTNRLERNVNKIGEVIAIQQKHAIDKA